MKLLFCALLALMLAAFTHGQACQPPAAQPLEGLPQRVCDRGTLNILSAVARSRTIPSMSESRVTVDNIRVTELSFDISRCAVYSMSETAVITLGGVSLRIDADWRRRWLRRRYRRGTLTATASNSVLRCTVPTFFSRCISPCGTQCTATLNNYRVGYTGSLLGVIPRRRIPDRIRSSVQSEATTLVGRFLRCPSM